LSMAGPRGWRDSDTPLVLSIPMNSTDIDAALVLFAAIPYRSPRGAR
jgi:hypothetical protein